MRNFYIRCEVITGYSSGGDSRVIFPYIRISSLYMGKFYVRYEVIAGNPSGDSRVNVNDVHSQSFDNLQEYPSEAKDVIPYIRPHCAYFWPF